MDTPTSGLSGDYDGLTVANNPAGLHFLPGSELALAVDFGGSDEEDATGPGPGFGLFAAGIGDGRLLPKLGWGIALESLSPPRVVLSPDPGTPLRFTSALSLPLGKNASFGFAWRHFFDDDGGPLDSVDTYDVGLAGRFGPHFSVGAVVRDLNTPKVAGTPVQRRYELELASRPTATDRLELALGGRIGEVRADFENGDDIDGWLRAAVRVVDGVYLRGQVETRSLFELTTGPVETESEGRREWRMVAGLDLSFGGLGAAVYGKGAINPDNDGRYAGFTLVAKISERGRPPLLTPAERIERLDLKGAIGERDLTLMVAKMRRLARDEKVAAVVVQIDGLSAGWASTNELRNGLLELRAAGKTVFVYMVAGSTREYYLATAANKIYVDPAGGLRLVGMHANSLYFKGLFDKLGVVAQFGKVDEYKSAPEAYTRTGPTEPAFIARNELYDSIFEHLVRGIADARGLSAERVRILIDNGPYTSGDLEKIPELVDAVATPEELTNILAKEMGGYYPVGSEPNLRDERWDYPNVAIIYIDGDIVDGKSQTIPILNQKLVGGETISQTIAAARASREIDAIILRIDSPGGSALASEAMAREVFKTRGVKPIICSMGDIAASGGYFAAAGCDVILADPMTITGSIGIFNGKFDFSGLAEKIGLSWTSYKRGELADMDSFLRSYSEDEMRLLRRKLHYYYGRFIRYVAEGRKLTTDQVDQVGRGRVWTGAQAMPIQLIDRFGGIGEAISLSKKRLGLTEDDRVRLVLLPEVSGSLLSQLLKLGGAKPGVLEGEMGPTGEAEPDPAQVTGQTLLRALLPGAGSSLIEAIPGSVWAQPDVPQARLPFTIIYSE